MQSKKLRNLILFITIVFFNNLLSGQSTGLVLSGGGAKGIAHIGVIKALEENNVKIDYIAGTSIGAIVGSLYAMGYSPDEMMELFKSEDFARWKTGEIEPRYKFSYKNNSDNPALINIPIVTNSNETKPQIPSYLIPSQVMDFAFMELTCGANAACEGDFNKLMIPFRSIAADIYNKKAHIFRGGNLADAVRSSMTYPIYFEPIVVDSILLFDGGIYNNFPFDVLVEDFNPDFIIGSKVTNSSKKPDKDNLMLQIENMVMQPTNFDLPDSLGIVVESKFTDVNLLDFEKADSLYLAGYQSAMKAMPDILKRANYISSDDLNMKRQEFINEIPDLIFGNIKIYGVNEEQEEYIKNLISRQEEKFTLNRLKEEYFRLVSEENIKNAYPEALYDINSGTYDLILDVKLKSAYSLSAGGLLSFTSYNQGFLEFNYYKLSDIFNRFSTNMYLGRYYTSFGIAHRIAIPKKEIIFVDLKITENRWNYYSNDITSLFDAYFPSYIQRRETSFEAAVGRPVNNFTTIRGRLLFGWIRDNYFQDINLVETGAPDNTQYLNGSFKIQLESRRFNRRQFPTEGAYTTISASINTGYEYFETGSTDTVNIVENEGLGHSWYKLNFRRENYFNISQRFTLGAVAELTVSNKGYSSNYTATRINSYGFRPTDFSNLIYAESLRANSFLGFGLKPILTINNNFSLRSGAYLFVPFVPISSDSDNIIRGDILSEYRYVAEIGAVYHTPVGPVSIGANIFSHEPRKVYYYLNFGYILFNKSGLD